MTIGGISSTVVDGTYRNQKQTSSAEETSSSVFDAILNAKGTEESPKQENSVGVIFRQMVMSGNQQSSIVHDGVPMSFSAKKNENGSYKFETRIGVENANTKWCSIMTNNGTVTFDLNDPGSVMKCLDMFSSEDAKKIMEKIQMQKVANAIEGEIDSRLDTITGHMQDKLEANTNTGADNSEGDSTESVDNVPSQEQLNQLLVDRDAIGTEE